MREITNISGCGIGEDFLKVRGVLPTEWKYLMHRIDLPDIRRFIEETTMNRISSQTMFP